MPALRKKQSGLRAQLDVLEAEMLDRETYDALAENLEKSLRRLQDGAEVVAFIVAWQAKGLPGRTLRLADFAFLTVMCSLVFPLDGLPPRPYASTHSLGGELGVVQACGTGIGESPRQLA